MKNKRKNKKKDKDKKDIPSKAVLMYENRTGYATNFTNKVNPFSISTGTINIGKYMGKKMSDIPTSYLKWMLDKITLTLTATSIIKTELALREKK